jgi:type I restriction enzyme, S subunit
MIESPIGWEWKNLADIAADEYGLVDGPFGSNLRSSEYTEVGVPVIRGSNLTLGTAYFVDDEFVFISESKADELARSNCFAEDIVFTKKGTLGQTGIIPNGHRFKRFVLSSNQMKITVNKAVADPYFVYYFVSSPASVDKIKRDAEATGVPKTNLAYLRTFPTLLPPLDEQRAIAEVLGSLDDKIEANRRQNATLEATARTIFKSWFVDFDPVHAKARGDGGAVPRQLRGVRVGADSAWVGGWGAWGYCRFSEWLCFQKQRLARFRHTCCKNRLHKLWHKWNCRC